MFEVSLGKIFLMYCDVVIVPFIKKKLSLFMAFPLECVKKTMKDGYFFTGSGQSILSDSREGMLFTVMNY